jgi:hypothetical protein
MNRSRFAGAGWIESRRQSYLLRLGIVSLFSFSWRHIADWLKRAAMVEPVDPFEDSELNSLQRAPGSSPAYDRATVTDGLPTLTQSGEGSLARNSLASASYFSANSSSPIRARVR